MLLRAFAFAFILGLSAIAEAAAADPSQRLPNIVFLFADDLGYSDLACYGHPYARTPNLDKLASEGTRFEQFYVTGITCCPSRTGFMTGKFPATYHKYPADFGFGDRVTITELLHQQGYRTGHFGKWHIGPTVNDGTYGIDIIGNDDKVNHSERLSTRERGRDAHIYDDAIGFIEENRDRPFYVNVWGHITHFPVNPPESYAELFKDVKVNEADFSDFMKEKFDRAKAGPGDPNDRMRKYLGDVFSLDEDVGRLLKKLDELDLRENTIVVFSSDHGASGVSGEIGPDAQPFKLGAKRENDGQNEYRLNMMGYNGHLRGGKHNMYDGGVRVPFIVRWPGRVPAGRIDKMSVIGGIDWLPTLCGLTGIKTDADDFDGQDVSSVWLGESSFTRTKPLFWKVNTIKSDVALRDGKWKIHVPYKNGDEVELFDLAADPEERTNVAAENPKVVKKLQAEIDRWNATLPRDYVKGKGKDD